MKKKWEWPWVSRKTMENKVASELDRIRVVEAKRRASMQTDWDNQWKPLLTKAIALSATRKPDMSSFVLHVNVDRGLLEMAAMHNDSKIWKYISDQTSYEFKRQIATLNFVGLHRLAHETEERYSRSHMAKFDYTPFDR